MITTIRNSFRLNSQFSHSHFSAKGLKPTIAALRFRKANYCYVHQSEHHRYLKPEKGNVYESLQKCEANYVPLSPISFLERAVRSFGNRLAIVHGDRKYSYKQTYNRIHRLANGLQNINVKPGDTVSILLPNIPETVESHFGVPLSGAVLNTINTRLEPKTVAYILQHSKAKALLVDKEFSLLAKSALEIVEKESPQQKIYVIDVHDKLYQGDKGESIGSIDYESFLANADPHATEGNLPFDEWQAISLSYTSGTTGVPKGVVYSHRGAYLNALANGLSVNMCHNTSYLWTLPMFHCNGWCFPYTVTVFGGTHVCLRNVSPEDIFREIKNNDVNHMCGAPIVLNMMAQYAKKNNVTFTDKNINIMTAGAPPAPTVLKEIESLGFSVTHTYGLTETYGPAVGNVWQQEWAERTDTQKLKARQGVTYPVQEELSVRDKETGEECPPDGQTIGEVVMRGNVVMKGYLNNDVATKECFKNGWFWTGDLGVLHDDGYIELKDRAKDLIISGGENISSVEVEQAIHKHRSISEVAVVARKSEKWGETPVAFCELKAGEEGVTEKELLEFCRHELAHFKCPSAIIFTTLPKTSTGKIQKFQLRKSFEEMEKEK